jgi:hypothetical protein
MAATPGCATDDRELEVSLPHCAALLTCCSRMTSLTLQSSCLSDVNRLEANQADGACAQELAADQQAMPPLCP